MDDLRRSRIPWVGQDDGELGFDGQPNGVAVGTVHRFQGGERRVVIFSTVVTREASLGFINERVNLINVAVSRAREHLVIIGHEATLKQGRFSRLLLNRSRGIDRSVEPAYMAHNPNYRHGRRHQNEC